MKWSVIKLGYKSEVRMILTKESLKVFKEYLTRNASKINVTDLIKSADLNKEIRNIHYLVWNNLKSNETEILRESQYKFLYDSLTFRLGIIGEMGDDIQIEEFTNSKDEKYNIPHLIIQSQFDEKIIRRQIKEYSKIEEIELD